MLDKKFTRRMNMLLSTTVISSMLFNFNVKAEKKPTYAPNMGAILGDMYFKYDVSNMLKALKIASERGLSGGDLDVYYALNDGIDPETKELYSKYYNLTNKVSLNDTLNPPLSTRDPEDENVWNKVKGKFNNTTGKFELYDAKQSTDSEIEVRPEYVGVISIDYASTPATITVPMGTGVDALKQMTQPKGTDKFIEQKYELSSDSTTLTVTAENGSTTTYTIIMKSGGGGQEDSSAPVITKDLDPSKVSTYSLNETEDKVDSLVVEATGTGTLSYQWYKQKVGAQPKINRATVPVVGEEIVGATEASYKPLTTEAGTNLYYAVVTNTDGEKQGSQVASKMATVVVSEGELTDTEFTVSDYVYNDDSKDTKTMGKLTGTAPSGAKITIEANFTQLAAVDAADGKWEATFPRQNAGTIIKVTAVADGKTKVETIEVKAAESKDIEDFRKNIDLNKLIEVRDNLHVSEDGKDVSNGYWIKSQTEADAFEAYVNLIEAVLGYRYQISTVDLEYVQNIALSTLETYKDKIHQAGEVSTKATVSISRDGKGTVEVSYKDDSHSVTDGVYKVEADKGTSVTFTAKADAGNHFVKWVVDGNDDTTSGATLTKEVKADMSVKAVFEKEGEQPGDTFNTTLNVTGNGVVKVTSDDADMTAANGVYTSKSGSILTFEAIPQTGYEVNWPDNVDVNGQNKNVATLGVSKDDTVTVNFVKGAEEETSTTPSVSNYEFDIEQSDAEGNLYVRLTGKAGKGAEITFKNGETEITPLNKVIAGTDGTWTAVIPRQDGGATITVIAKEEGKKEATTTYSVPVAEDKEALTTLVDDIKTGILDKITSGEIKISEDGKDKDLVKGDKYLKPIERDAIETLNKLLSKLTGKTLSQADVNFIISTARPAFESIVPHIAEGPDESTTSKVTLSKVGNGNITIEDKDEGAIDGDTSSVTNGVYTVNNGKAVTITAIPDASNEVAGWLIDEKPSVETSKTTRELTVIKDTSVQAIFAPTKEAAKIDEVIKKVEEITNKGTTPVEVSISKTEPTTEEVKALVESEIESKLPEGATVSKVEVTKNETLAKATTDTISYTAKVTFKVGNVEFTITIEISVKVEETVSDVKLTLNVKNTENGKVVSVIQDGAGVSSEGNVYTVKSGKEVTFTVDPNPGYKATWSENVKEVTTGNPNVVTITPIGSETITLDFVKDSEVTDASKVILNVGENGVVKVEVDGTSLTPTVNVYTVENGKTVTFTAIPDTNYQVKEWTGATVDNTVADNTVAKLQVSADSTVAVEFEPKSNTEKEDTVKVLVKGNDGTYASVSAEVYNSGIDEAVSFAVDNAVYSIYAQVSDAQAEFSIPSEATTIDISFDMNVEKTVNNTQQTLTDAQIKEILKYLQISSNRRTYTTPTLSDDNKKLNVTLDLDTMKTSANEVNEQSATTIEFSYNNTTSKNKPLKFGAYKFKK